MNALQQREKMILTKYMQAEDIRETSKIIKDTKDIMKYQPKLKLYNVSKHQLELENRLLEAWKERQEKLNHINRKQKLESIDNSEMLHKKIRKEAKNQEKKMIRNMKPERPKLEPLPYMKKIRENLSKSLDVIDTPIPGRTPSPQDVYITKRVQFELFPSSDEKKSSVKYSPKFFKFKIDS